MQDFSKFIREIPNFPEPGILFKDITPLLENGTVFHSAIEVFASHYRSESFSFRFFGQYFSQLLIFSEEQKSRDFSRDFCYTSP